MENLTAFLDGINAAADRVVSGLCLLGLAFIVVRYMIDRMQHYTKKDGPNGFGKGLFLGVIALIEGGLLVLIIWYLPQFMEGLFTGKIAAPVFRWVLLYLIFPAIFYFSTRKYSGSRSLIAILAILTIGLLGWLFEKWIGVIFISIPIYSLSLHVIYRLAQVVLPASDPEDKKEKSQKFKVFLYYILGVQYPFWVASSPVSRDPEMRISGDYFNESFPPGTVWTYSHQVAGISAGIEFNNVEGPGLLFTKRYDRPIAFMDLRKQKRVKEFDATTKDGISIKPILFVSFGVDNEDWPKKEWKREDFERLKKDFNLNPTLSQGLKLDRHIGIFSFSTARVKSILSTVGINSNISDAEADKTIHWDEWVVMQAENVARQIISQRTLDELWKPVNNKPGTSALDEIANQIRTIIELRLFRVGINLHTVRVVNFSLPEDDPIRVQQIATWKTLWNQRITAARAEAEALAKEEIEKAHAYAKSQILEAIADGIENARREHADLPRHVIALYYIHIIEEYFQKQPEVGSKEAKERLDWIKNYLLFNQ